MILITKETPPRMAAIYSRMNLAAQLEEGEITGPLKVSAVIVKVGQYDRQPTEGEAA